MDGYAVIRHNPTLDGVNWAKLRTSRSLSAQNSADTKSSLPLAAGGMGEVYTARDQGLNRMVANQVPEGPARGAFRAGS
jgi:hypothetical protein